MRILLFLFLVFTISCQPEKAEEKTMHKYTNHLAGETSPYLQQHAHNPVNWYPWGEEALQKAKDENKPILVSIGYAACHWCHVMEHESFEDEETAKIMNELFVCIKVDREERPDIDQVYMAFVQMTTGSGGWPLNVFLTPDQQPYYGGTYFPPDDRYGRPSWRRILHSADDFYRNQKDKLHENLAMISDAYKRNMQDDKNGNMPTAAVFQNAVESLSASFDSKYGGLGSAPKFPAVQPMELFLRQYRNTGDKKYLDMVTFSLRKMAEGGIYDQLGGGFARYSVDDKWLVPHFEKMLYDNAQLAPLYLDVYLITKDPFYLTIAEETLQFVLRELHSEEGAFYSSLDADSEGEEGKFYVWTKKEISALLNDEQSAIFSYRFDVTTGGNFEGKTILNVRHSVAECANKFKRSETDINALLVDAKSKLFAERSKRVRPGLDNKALTAWNGLMLSAFARAYQITGKEIYAKTIRENVAFIKKYIYGDGKLLRTYNHGVAKYDAFLDDYALLTRALLDSYEALFDSEYLEMAIKIHQYAQEIFWDEQNHGYFYTSKNQQALIHRMKDEHDNSTPSGSGVMVLNHLRLYSLTGETKWIQRAESILTKYSAGLSRSAYGYASYLIGLDFYLRKPKEIVIVKPAGTDWKAFHREIFDTYRPNKVVMLVNGDGAAETLAASLVQGKTAIEGKPTAFVCYNFACSAPVTDIKKLTELLHR